MRLPIGVSRRLVSRETVILFALCAVLQPFTLSAQETQNAAPPPQEGSVPMEPQVQDNLPPVAPAALPPSLTIPAGSFVTVRLLGSLSSDINLQGDGFTATLEQPIVVDGWVIARRGQIVVGRVAEAQKAGRVKGVSSLGLVLNDLPVVDGRQLPIVTQLVQASAGTSKGRDALGVATATGMGAAIGGAVDGGTGAGIGAGIGAAAGIAGVLLTPGRPTVIPPEAVLTFRLQEPVTVDTQRSAVAFVPVSQQDYASAPRLPQPPVVPAYPPPPPYPYPYSYPYAYPFAAWPYWGGWGFYPSVSFVGYYRGYGWAHGGRWH